MDEMQSPAAFPAPPATRRGDVVEVLHGHEVADPYRWLEDPDTDEVRDWVERQREHAEQVLDRMPARAWFRRTMRDIVLRPRAGTVVHLAGRFAVARNDGTQAQNVWFVADTPQQLEHGGGTLLLDPNTWSSDGTASLGGLGASPDHRTLGYVVNEAGSDWQHIRFLDLATGVPLDEPELVTKFSPVRFLADSRTLVYSAVDADPGSADGTRTGAVDGRRVMLHTLGTTPDADRVLTTFDGQEMAWPSTSHDDQWLVLTIEKGTESNCRVWAYRQRVVDGQVQLGEPVRLVDRATAEWRFVDAVGDTAWFVTDLDAPLSRVVQVDLAASERAGGAVWHEVIAEGSAQVAAVVLAGGELVVETLEDAVPVLQRYSLDGIPLGRIDVQGGELVGLDGRPDRSELLVGMSTLTEPTACHLVEGGRARRLQLADAAPSPVPQVTLLRRRTRSSDGVEVPYFLAVPQGVDLDQPRPTLLHGYGGFRAAEAASWRPVFAGWLAAGGVVVVANLRGGGEFGTQWYEQGKRERKQQVFDDAIAVAEHLVATGVTTPQQLVAHGRSNGGLLVGALITQRPDLFAAALPTVGVLDMLRFHRFTIGAAWISDYGDPDDPHDFEVALRYSPLHNVRPGTRYPATLVATGDHDDRVVPLHSHKFTATLQQAQQGPAPVITRIESATGHGAGKPAAMVADEAADLLAFAAHFAGLDIG